MSPMTTNHELAHFGIINTGTIHKNLSVSQLVEMAIRRGEGHLASNGALVTNTAPHTGRSPKDKYVVEEPTSKDKIWWENNKKISQEKFDTIFNRVRAYLQGKEVFVFDGFAGADTKHRLSVRVVTEKAWHSLFAKTLFIRPTEQELAMHHADWTVINVCGLQAIPEVDGLNSKTYIILNFEKKIVLIGGTFYAGEIKKSIFTVMNYILPEKGIFPMHCSANSDKEGNVTLFFGLSGTGKTTLSADPLRRLIGDDEHGWTENGVFNFEGGCYAKTIKLSKEGEPQIWNAIRFGSVLENVVLRQDGTPNYDSAEIAENTRVTYPVEYIDNCIIPGIGGHPRNICFLVCDAYGVLPPISKLSPAQAMYHFLSGYTAKVAGTEAGVTEPTPTFSTCFGAPFWPLHPNVYAELLRKKLTEHKSNVWLVNTGWSGGGNGVGARMKLSYTRGLITAALSGKLDNVKFTNDPVFGVAVPETCPDVPAEILVPKNTWKDKAAYDTAAKKLADLFIKNFEKFAAKASDDVKQAGPKV